MSPQTRGTTRTQKGSPGLPQWPLEMTTEEFQQEIGELIKAGKKPVQCIVEIMMFRNVSLDDIKLYYSIPLRFRPYWCNQKKTCRRFRMRDITIFAAISVSMPLWKEAISKNTIFHTFTSHKKSTTESSPQSPYTNLNTVWWGICSMRSMSRISSLRYVLWRWLILIRIDFIGTSHLLWWSVNK